MTARLAVIADHLKAAQHPAGLLAAAAELPPAADPVAAGHRHRPPAARHGSAGDDRVRPFPVDFVTMRRMVKRPVAVLAQSERRRAITKKRRASVTLIR